MISFPDVHRLILPIIATENLIMAATLLLMYIVKKNYNLSYRLSILFLSSAMFLLALINYAEIFLPIKEFFLPFSMSVMVFAASLELFLLFYSFMALLDQRFVTMKKVIVELLLIAIFTLPPLLLFWCEPVFRWWFGIAILFYLVKFSYNFYLYKRYFLRMRRELLDYYSDERNEQILWINNVFYMVVIVGAVSVVVPLTNYAVLSFYNLFLFFAYFYIYFEVLRHDFFFEEVRQEEKGGETMKEQAKETAKEVASLSDFMTNREVLFNQWMDSRAYTRQHITIEDVARELGANRTKLSIYLNSELHMNFYDWISRLRMEEAKRLLIENPNTPVLEIAIQVGIDDRSNFDKTFKRIVGMSSFAYRKTVLPTNVEADSSDGISN